MAHCSNVSIRLRAAKAGETVRVVRIEGQEPVCRRLREMGFCEMASVRVLNTAGGLVCQVCGARVGLSRQLAESIVVTRPAA
jgi:ferrous iron transport protein A